VLSAAYTTAFVVPAGTLKSVGPVISALVNEAMFVLDELYDAIEIYAISLTGVTCNVTSETLVAVTMSLPDSVC